MDPTDADDSPDAWPGWAALRDALGLDQPIRDLVSYDSALVELQDLIEVTDGSSTHPLCPLIELATERIRLYEARLRR